MVTLIAGILAVIIGSILLGSWRHEFLSVLMGTIPILLILGGLIAVYGGYSSIEDKKEAKKEEDKAKKKEKKK